MEVEDIMQHESKMYLYRPVSNILHQVNVKYKHKGLTVFMINFKRKFVCLKERKVKVVTAYH